MYKLRVLQYLIYPVLLFSQAVPVVALAPPSFSSLVSTSARRFWSWRGSSSFPVTVAFLQALNDTDRDLVNLARVAGAGRWRTFWLIEFPAASTGLFSGLRLGATYAVTGAIIGEMAASTGTSLAIYQQHANNNLDTASVYGTTLLMAVIGIAWFGAVVALDYLATPWKHRATAPRWWPSARHDSKFHPPRRKDS
jgi:ABC-type nitrate/sulfonate/bicarbonate transport system permease component